MRRDTTRVFLRSIPGWFGLCGFRDEAQPVRSSDERMGRARAPSAAWLVAGHFRAA